MGRGLLLILLGLWGCSAAGTGVTPVPPPPLGPTQLRGLVFHDRNGNGLRDPDEPPLAGIPVMVAGVGQQVTGADGRFQLTGINPGTYELRLGLGPGQVVTGMVPDRGARIIGGEPAPVYPWMVALINSTNPRADTFVNQFCAGSLITPEWVLSAAHCFFDGTTPARRQLQVLQGTNTLGDGSGTLMPVRQVITHPAYTPTRIDLGSDLALLRLERPIHVPSLSLVGPGSLNLTNPGVSALVTGWGKTSETAPRGSRVLQAARVPIVSNSVCAQAFRQFSALFPTTPTTAAVLCAGFADGRADTCQGDSGGPLLVPSGSQGWVQAGVTSYGEGCARPNLYGVYTRVSSFTDFVSSTLAAAPLSVTLPQEQSLNFGVKDLF
ncbi:MAG: trypsin-like serine protease [Thermostichales cyanobacterium GMQP_bins_62]